MASFHANIGWERPRKRENKKNRPDGFLPDPENEIQKKQQKNSKNQKTPSQLFFKAKIGWGRPRKRENKKNRSNGFLPDPEQKIPKKIA